MVREENGRKWKEDGEKFCRLAGVYPVRGGLVNDWNVWEGSWVRYGCPVP